MPFINDDIKNISEEVLLLSEYNKKIIAGVENIKDSSPIRDVLQISSPIDFKLLTISYMNEEAKKYGYPDIFAAMALKNSSIVELVAEGASWTEFFDAGMTFVDYEIKTGGYTAFTQDIDSVKEDPLSPKVTFTPSLTYPSVSA
jgi:hypothetical protein